MSTFGSALPLGIKNALIGYKEGDKPLLDELGIDFNAIKRDSLRIVFIKSTEHKDTMDMVGPLLFIILYGVILFIRSAVHIGYLYYLSTISCMFIYVLLILMNNNNRISILGIINALGYALIPILIFATIGKFLPTEKSFKLFIGALFFYLVNSCFHNRNNKKVPNTRQRCFNRLSHIFGIFMLYDAFYHLM
ncbi:hypothetical protein NEQG_00388 [Nematocida parisii ERTm3]|uniref:Protein YIP n=1 Tax=Nematocida parisii (strain ERTm3) TaxID=935791 RepID=I3EK71_NEMP3|nr:hypothetical protein NEQG_00388 [Nematocida parisii ERTm3]